MRYIPKPRIVQDKRNPKDRVPVGAWVAALVTLVLTLALLWADAGGS